MTLTFRNSQSNGIPCLPSSPVGFGASFGPGHWYMLVEGSAKEDSPPGESHAIGHDGQLHGSGTEALERAGWELEFNRWLGRGDDSLSGRRAEGPGGDPSRDLPSLVSATSG